MGEGETDAQTKQLLDQHQEFKETSEVYELVCATFSFIFYFVSFGLHFFVWFSFLRLVFIISFRFRHFILYTLANTGHLCSKTGVVELVPLYVLNLFVSVDFGEI